MYEDICLTHQVLREGGHTLKCQSYCFWAAHSKKGGASDARGARDANGTALSDVMAPMAFGRLEAGQREAINELLTWVKSHEKHNTAIQEERKILSLSLTDACVAAAVAKGAGKKGRSEEKKKARDHKYEYKMRRANDMKKREAERKLRRQMGLPSPPPKRRRKTTEDNEGGSDGEISSTRSGSDSSSSSSDSSDSDGEQPPSPMMDDRIEEGSPAACSPASVSVSSAPRSN